MLIIIMVLKSLILFSFYQLCINQFVFLGKIYELTIMSLVGRGYLLIFFWKKIKGKKKIVTVMNKRDLRKKRKHIGLSNGICKCDCITVPRHTVQLFQNFAFYFSLLMNGWFVLRGDLVVFWCSDLVWIKIFIWHWFF